MRQVKELTAWSIENAQGSVPFEFIYQGSWTLYQETRRE